MQISESLHYIRSDNTNFRNPLVINASQYADLPITSSSSATGPNKLWINTVKIQSIQNLDWRLEFHGRSLAAGGGGTYTASGYIGTNSLEGYIGFTNNAATAYGTTYLYYTQGLKLPYEDQDGTGMLHVNLLNQHSATSKNPGDSGAVFITVGCIAAS